MQEGPTAFLLLAGGERLVTFTEAHTIVWDVNSGRRLRALRNGGTDGGGVRQVAASTEGKIVARCGTQRGS